MAKSFAKDPTADMYDMFSNVPYIDNKSYSTVKYFTPSYAPKGDPEFIITELKQYEKPNRKITNKLSPAKQRKGS